MGLYSTLPQTYIDNVSNACCLYSNLQIVYENDSVLIGCFFNSANQLKMALMLLAVFLTQNINLSYVIGLYLTLQILTA